MSVRAYKLNSIDHAEAESFNLWHDDVLVDALMEGGYLDALNDSGGIFEVPVSVLKSILTELAPDGSGKLAYEISDFAREHLSADVAEAERLGKDVLEYYCY